MTRGRGFGLRNVLVGLTLMTVAGCAAVNESKDGKPIDPLIVASYAPVQGEPFRVPAVPLNKIDSQYYRQTVATPADFTYESGTIVVDPYNRFLYLVQENGQSIRYGIGVGKQGFAWAGEAQVWDKQHWPKWFPPKEMQERDEYAARFPNGMDGGPRNPLGSRALYLYEGKCNANNIRTENCKDTLYRIHATNEPLSIGKAVSSGCIRMWNQDVMDLYERVPMGTKVVVLTGPENFTAPGLVPVAASGGVQPVADAI